jgi:pimeloyl-ACP methyl ester carboxylesterase
MLDFRGHGRSDAPEDGYSLDVLAADVAAVITALRLKPAAVVGHSLGAMVVAELAAGYPDLVRCIVLEDPSYRFSERAPEEWAAAMDNFRSSTIALKAMTAEQMNEYSLRTNPRRALWHESDVAGWIDAKQRLSLRAIDGMRAYPPRWREAVARITCPALILAGDPALGGFCSPETVREIRWLNPRIEVINIPEAGHQLRREAFSTYIDAVTSFLGAHV